MAVNVGKEIKRIMKSLTEKGIYRTQSEVVRDSVRQLAIKHAARIESLEEVRNIIEKANKKSRETLSQTVKKMREEA
ncbi:MAG: hypothetical protein QME59_04250 [Candidatus Hydrothermarchaeota archaeon]|nr:hypothetical protein [Candidatus Hydrothermarchaeota archaeon]